MSIHTNNSSWNSLVLRAPRRSQLFMKRRDIHACWSVADRGTKEEMGLSLRDIWVQPRNRPVNEMGLMPAGSRNVWIQTDDLDAQGTIIVPVCLNEPLIYFTIRLNSLGQRTYTKCASSLLASCLFHSINCAFRFPSSLFPPDSAYTPSAQTWTSRRCPRQTPSWQRTRFRQR